MPILFAAIFAALVSLVLVSLNPSGGSLSDRVTYQTQVRNDILMIEGGLRAWFKDRTYLTTKGVDDGSCVAAGSKPLLPACSVMFTRLVESYLPHSIAQGDANGNPYVIQYLGNNSLTTTLTGLSGIPIEIPPLDIDANGGYVNLPTVVVAARGVNGIWDSPTIASGGKIVVAPYVFDYLAGLNNATLPATASLGDDVFYVVKFDDIVNERVGISRDRLRNVLSGLGVYYNYKSISQPGYYPLSINDFATWSSALSGLNALPKYASPLTVDGFGIPLYYSPTGIYLDSPTNTKPIQVDVDVEWFSNYNL